MRVAQLDRGFTLAELLVAMTVAEIVAVIALGTTIKSSTMLRGRLERAGAASTLRGTRAVVAAELAQLGRDSLAGADLVAVDPTAIEYRAHRGVAVICRFTADSLYLDRDRLNGWRDRLPDPGRDSLLVYAPGDTLSTIDGWWPVGLLAGPESALCPAGRPALRYAVSVDSTRLAALYPGELALARIFEASRLRYYGGSGTGQVGYQSVSTGAAVQPFAGPLRFPDGWSIDLLDGDWAGGASLPEASALRIRVAALARRDVAVGSGHPRPAVDSAEWIIPFENFR